MADLPKYSKLTYPTLQAIKEAGGSATIDEIEVATARILKLSDEQLAIPHGNTGRTEFQYRLAWVRTYLKKVGALENSERGVWTLSPAGAAYSEHDAERVFQSVNAKRSAKKSAGSSAVVELSIEDSPSEMEWVESMLVAIGRMSASAFERLCQRLLRESGFTKVEVTGRPSDGGIDGNGVLRMNLVSFQVLFQSKRWKSSVGPSVVRDFRGAMVGRADKGLIITTSTFTPEAKREATRDGAPAIDLIEGEDLCHLLKAKRLGVSVTMVEEVTVDDAFFERL